jgi:hypothetical protein
VVVEVLGYLGGVLALVAGFVLGLGLAVALVVAGSALRRNVPLGIGAAGMVVFLGQVAGEHWRDLGAPLAILLVGLGLVAAAVALARLRPVADDRPRPSGRRASETTSLPGAW